MQLILVLLAILFCAVGCESNKTTALTVKVANLTPNALTNDVPTYVIVYGTFDPPSNCNTPYTLQLQTTTNLTSSFQTYWSGLVYGRQTLYWYIEKTNNQQFFTIKQLPTQQP